VGPGAGLSATASGVWEGAQKKKDLLFAPPSPILAFAAGPGDALAVGAEQGLFLRQDAGSEFQALYPAEERYSWAPRQVSAVAFDSFGRLWFGSDQGVGVLDGDDWRLYTGAEGLPYDQFTCATAGEDGVIWFGTEFGAIRFDGERWDYYANLRWLPDNHVHDIAVDEQGTAWIATSGGVARIERHPMTLQEKAAYFLDQVETRHNRDGYITNWKLERRGDVSSAVPAITDNDGKYTSMYGAAMAFKYAATGDPEARALAQRSFEACKRLVDIVPDSMKGFPARVLIPIDWHEPVNEQYSEEANQRRLRSDPFWKQIWPRFPTSEDGQYMWKNDTSSDELSGHYFFYAIYHDLVAETEEEKAAVREVVRDITDHLIRNDFNLVDHDGLPTRWGRFGPDFLHTHEGWSQLGLNSMMMLAILSVAEHVTGDPEYGAVAQMLREEHHYHINAMIARPTYPPTSVVPWDNNLALLMFYPLMRYEQDPELLLMYRMSLQDFFMFISNQKNAFWSVAYGACVQHFEQKEAEGFFDNAFPDSGPYTRLRLARLRNADMRLDDALDTLREMPLELIGWEMKNSHRLDIQLDPTPGQRPNYGWSRVDGKAISIKERSHVRQDRDGFALDASEDNGYSEHEGTFFLLPYYMALYHGFID